MARVTGPSRAELDERGDEFAARVTRAIRTTLRSVAPTTRVVDDLGRIETIWRSVVKNSLAPHLREQWNAAVLGVRVQLEELNARERETLLAAGFVIPQVSNVLAENFLAEATNRLVAIGDVVWYTARGEMLAGMQLGEGVAELRERVVASANVSHKRAEVIARTEVNSAMNNGAYQQMKALDVPTIKEWIATNDSRTRESHEEVDGEEIAGDAKFMVGGFPMDHPHDLNAPPSETINCRCTLAWEIDDDDDYWEDALTAAGDFDESKHKRDGKGRFAKKAGSGTPKAGKKLKVTHGIVHKKHEPGTIIAVSGSDSKRVVWDGNKYLLQEKQVDGGWVTTNTAIKSKAYVEIGKFDDDWREPTQGGIKDDDAADAIADAIADAVNNPKPKAAVPTKSKAPKVSKSGAPLKITHGLVHSKYEPGTVLAENGAGDKRVVWDGAEYRLQSKKDDGSWTTEKKVKKSKAYVEVNAYDSDWRTPAQVNGKDSGQPEAGPESPKSLSESTSTPAPQGKPGDPLELTHEFLQQDHKVDTVIATSSDGNMQVYWNGEDYEIQEKTGDPEDDEWDLLDVAPKSAAYDIIKLAGSDWVVPQSDEGALRETSSPAVSQYKPMDPSLVKIASLKKGGVFKDKYGDVYSIQPTQSESHARNELLASKLYAYAAVGVQHVELVEADPDKLNSPSGIGVKTDHNPGQVSLIEAIKTMPVVQKQVNENFAFDAWLGNWDVVGLGYENIKVTKSGVARRTNLGGSLLYRANGSPKGNAFGDTVNEIDSLRDPHINPASAKVFADVTDDDIRAGVAKIEKITPDDIDYLVSQAGFTGKEADLLSSKLQARRADLISKYGVNAPKPAQSSGPAPSTLPTATNALGGTTKTYTAVQKAKVKSIFDKHNLKWFNKTDQIFDAAHEVSTTHPDLTMGDALDIMDQSLKKKSGNPFRTKVEKWLKTKAGKNHALVKGGSASLGGTAPKVSPASVVQSPSVSSSSGGGHYQQLSKPSASAMQDAMNKTTPPPWTADQRQALTTYTGGSYTKINQCARGTTPCDPTTKKTLEDIKSAMKPSTSNIVLYRATNPASFGISSGDELEAMVGKTINDNGVISTSITKIGWSGKIKLEIEVPKGSHMAWVQPISHHPSENEMVLAPGTHYEVVSYEKQSGYYGDSYSVKLRVIPGSDTRSQELAQKELVSA